MATTQEKQTFVNNISPLKEHAQEEDIDYYEENVLGSGCCCFRIFCFKRWRSNDKERRNLLEQKGECREKTWWVKKLKEMKEASEVLAGPKWKTFIRKFGGYCNNNKKHNKNPFQYDPHSYALNFDGGVDREEDGLLFDFSARFAPPFPDDQRRTES